MHAQAPTTLSALRDHKRVLLIVGGDADPLVEQQWKTLADHSEEAAERDLITVRLSSSPVTMHGGHRPPEAVFTQQEQRAVSARFHIPSSSFTVLLVGKDGGEKLREDHPIGWNILQNTIDAMPMRQDEMRR